MVPAVKNISQKSIFVFWLPLAATWLMMSVEGPFIAAIIARLADPKFNLAAYGVAFSFGLIIEAPVIMMLSASVALVKNKQSFFRLRAFTLRLNVIISLFMLLLIIPQVFWFIGRDLIGLPDEVTRLTHVALIIFLPWPAAIGYRRFYQGILIRHNLTRRVAYGTIVRLTTMAGSALLLAFVFDLPGAWVGTGALSIAVTMEALTSRIMAHGSIKKITGQQDEQGGDEELTYRGIIRFYYPLALTSLLGLAVHPFVTFFVGQSRHALESLAVIPVINSLVFIFRSLGLSYQEVVITFLGDRNKQYPDLRRFALLLMGFVTLCLGLIAFTPLSGVWFHLVSGLSRELTAFAILPTRLLFILPALTVLISLQRGVLVNSRTTGPITWATAIEVGGIVAVMALGNYLFNWIGAISFALALMTGRAGANLYLTRSVGRALR